MGNPGYGRHLRRPVSSGHLAVLIGEEGEETGAPPQHQADGARSLSRTLSGPGVHARPGDDHAIDWLRAACFPP